MAKRGRIRRRLSKKDLEKMSRQMEKVSKKLQKDVYLPRKRLEIPFAV